MVGKTCALHGKEIRAPIKKKKVEQDNSVWLGVSNFDSDTWVCQKCYDKKRDAVRLTNKTVPSDVAFPRLQKAMIASYSPS